MRVLSVIGILDMEQTRHFRDGRMLQTIPFWFEIGVMVLPHLSTPSNTFRRNEIEVAATFRSNISYI